MLPDLPRTTTALGKLDSGPGGLGIRQQDVRPPGAKEVLIEVLGAGICGTDLHIADDEFPYDAPVTMGHEVTGTVVATGDDVDSGWEGMRVACETYFSYCGSCRHCRDGRPNLCDRRRSIGSFVDGGFARWLTLPVRNLHRIPDHVGIHAGALAEPLACVAHCLFDPPVIDAGDRVMVTGPGTMGLLSAQAARAAGGEVTVVGLERDRARLDVAKSLGFDVIVPDEGGDRVVAPDVVLECSGAEAAAGFALEQVRKGGRYVQVGIFGRPVTLPVDQVLYKELTFTSGNASTPRSWNRAMRLLEQELVELDLLVGAVMPLADWEEAFALTRAGTGLKVILDPRQE